MEVIILKDAEAVAAMGAELVTELLRVKPDAILGLATGSTQLALYRQLIRQYQAGTGRAEEDRDAANRRGGLSFKQVSSFNLDEYLGVEAGNPQSYRSYMDREFFDHIDIDKRNTHLPACEEGQNPVLVGTFYEQKISDAGGVDLQILGIGSNGHIGFNEPSSSLASRTRVKTLTRRTFKDNSRLFSKTELQPKLAITMGIATIMDARKILLLATGENKADAVSKMVEGPVSAMCPASVLQMHQYVTVLLDEAAAAGLRNRDYYDWTHLQNESLKARFGAIHEP